MPANSGFRLLAFAQPHTRATTVLVDDFEAGGLYRSTGNFAWNATPTFTRSEQPKDRLSKSLDPENAGRFAWQA